ncbi:hypothetical protein ScPMuIL_012209 [Solemya velum]
MALEIFPIFLFVWGTLGETVDYTSNLVFDPLFYVQTNYDLQLHHLTSPSAARTHWLDYGIDEGRQACGSFHSKQYIERYPDIKIAFGATGYREAIGHFIRFQASEARLGYKEGGLDGRWTISNGNGLYLSASERMAGAVDSLVWNHKEFINAYDHGRELQMAINTDTFGECYNPTEAGGRDDGNTMGTKSRSQWVHVAGNVLQSEVLPSYWLRAESTQSHSSGGNCTRGSPALNTNDYYHYPMSKRVTIGCGGMQNCIEFISNFTIGGRWPEGFGYMQMESPTGYLAGDFTEKYSFNPETNQMIPYANNPHLPVALATTDGNYAMGAYAPGEQDTDVPMTYWAINFPSGQWNAATNKWNIVFRKHRQEDPGPHSFVYRAYFCVGTLSDVRTCLATLHGNGETLPVG